MTTPKLTLKKSLFLSLFVFVIFFIVVIVVLIIQDENISINNAKVTNLTDTSFTLVWTSEKPYIGKVVVKESSQQGWSQLFAQRNLDIFYDDRDVKLNQEGNYVQVESGAKKRFSHYVTVRNLRPETNYLFRVVGAINGKDPLDNSQVTTLSIFEDIYTPDPGYGKVNGVNSQDSIIIFEDKMQKQFSQTISDNQSYSIDMNLFEFNDLEDIKAVVYDQNRLSPEIFFTGENYKPLVTIELGGEDQVLDSSIDMDYFDQGILSIQASEGANLGEKCDQDQTTCNEGLCIYCNVEGIEKGKYCINTGCEAFFNSNKSSTTQSTISSTEGQSSIGSGVCPSGITKGQNVKNNNPEQKNLVIRSSRNFESLQTGIFKFQDSKTVVDCANNWIQVSEGWIYGGNGNFGNQIGFGTQSSGKSSQEIGGVDTTKSSCFFKCSDGLEHDFSLMDLKGVSCKAKQLELCGDNIGSSAQLIEQKDIEEQLILEQERKKMSSQEGQDTCTRQAFPESQFYKENGGFNFEKYTRECQENGQIKYQCMPYTDMAVVDNDKYACVRQCGLKCSAVSLLLKLNPQLANDINLNKANCPVKSVIAEEDSQYLIGSDIQNITYKKDGEKSGKVLGITQGEMGIKTEESGRYAFFANNEKVASEDIITNGNELTIMLYFDVNENGIKDPGEDWLEQDEYLKVKFSKEASAESFQLNSGWNLINIPMYDNREENPVQTASALLNYWDAQGVDIYHIARFRDGKFEIFSARKGQGESGEEYASDFDLIPGEALFVLNMRDQSTVTFSGNKYEESVPLRFNNGWNLVGIVSPGKKYNSEKFLTKMSEEGIDAQIISQFENGTYKSVIWEENDESANKLLYGNNFEIVEKRGYFIKVNSSEIKQFIP